LRVFDKNTFYKLHKNNSFEYLPIVTKKEINDMMESADLSRISFSSNPPFWCAVGYRKKEIK